MILPYLGFFSFALSFTVIVIVTSHIYSLKRANKVNHAYVLFSLWVAILIFINMMSFTFLINRNTVTFFTKTSMFFTLTIGFLFTNFTYTYLRKKRDPIFIALAGAVIIGIGFLFFSDAIVCSQCFMLGRRVLNRPGPHVLLFSLALVYLPFLYSFFLLFQRYTRIQSKEEKRPIKTFLTGSLLTFILLAVVEFLPNHMRFIGPLAPVAQALFTFYAVKFYNFFQIDTEHIAENLFAHSPEGILLVNEKDEVIDVNTRACVLFGVSNTTMSP